MLLPAPLVEICVLLLDALCKTCLARTRLDRTVVNAKGTKYSSLIVYFPCVLFRTSGWKEEARLGQISQTTAHSELFARSMLLEEGPYEPDVRMLRFHMHSALRMHTRIYFLMMVMMSSSASS